MLLFFYSEMRRDLFLLWILAISLVTLATGGALDDITQPCSIQSQGGQLRCVIPAGFKVRSGDCPGNDIWDLYRSDTNLEECARLCSSSYECQAFMFYDNRGCYPKTKTCGTTNKGNPLNVFYDKVPFGYSMRPGDCPGNDISHPYTGSVTRQWCAQFCDSRSDCVGFMHYDNHGCFPKTKVCGVSLADNSLNIFYDKVIQGYSLRGGDCPWNDIHLGNPLMSLTECANRCNSDSHCVSFMYFDGKECLPKQKTCAQPSIGNPKNVFYDKVPSGYAMRPGDCPGNDIGEGSPFSPADCAEFCDKDPECVSFMFHMVAGWSFCYHKAKTCQTTDKGHPNNFFYDKIVTV